DRRHLVLALERAGAQLAEHDGAHQRGLAGAGALLDLERELEAGVVVGSGARRPGRGDRVVERIAQEGPAGELGVARVLALVLVVGLGRGGADLVLVALASTAAGLRRELRGVRRGRRVALAGALGRLVGGRARARGRRGRARSVLVGPARDV